MARPAGKRMNGSAFRDLLRRDGLSMTEVAENCGVALTTMSGLVAGTHGASDKVLRSICDGMGVNDATLFPEVANFTYTPRSSEQAA